MDLGRHALGVVGDRGTGKVLHGNMDLHCHKVSMVMYGAAVGPLGSISCAKITIQWLRIRVMMRVWITVT